MFVKVSIAYGNGPPSAPLDLLLYDSQCWHCSIEGQCNANANDQCVFSAANSRVQTFRIGKSITTGEDSEEYLFCTLPHDSGSCDRKEFRYYYNSLERRCKLFVYGGCKGNQNNFLSETACVRRCGDADAIAALSNIEQVPQIEEIGGMAAVVLPEGSERQEVIDRVLAAKKLEIESGVDGFLLYDLGLVAPVTQLWDAYRGVTFNVRGSERVRPGDLLTLPKGGVTRPGLRKNVSVGILFISAWMDGKGTFVYQGSVEDSATAEISRSQVWQWIRHGARLEEEDEVVTVKMVKQFVKEFVAQMPGKHIAEASQLFLEIVTMRDFPEFITTLLSNSHVFRAKHQSRGMADDEI